MIFKTLKARERENLTAAGHRLIAIMNNIKDITSLEVNLYQGYYSPLAEYFKRYIHYRNKIDGNIARINKRVQKILSLDDEIKSKNYKMDPFRMYVMRELRDTIKVLARKRNGLKVIEEEFNLSKAGTEYYERQARWLREKEKERRL